MNRHPIEPGLLPVFRYFTLIGVGYFAANLFYITADPRGELISLEANAQLGLVSYTFLFLYLSWPGLERRLKRLYLPIALAVATAAPILSMIAFRLVLTSPVTTPPDMGPWSVFPVLFIPLVIIAWQYNFKAVLAFTILTASADLGLTLLSIDKISYTSVPTISAVLIRAFAYGIVGHIVCLLVDTQQEQRQNLISANVQLSRHAATLEELAVSQERNRLARELHDTLAHTLSGMAVNLEALKLMIPESMGEVRQMLDRSLQNTRSGLADTRRALKDLRSQPLDDLGLAIAIRELAIDTAGRAGLILDLDLPKEPLDLTADVEQTIYRIAQEALNNAQRHANARRLFIQLRQSAEGVTLCLMDNGHGFDPTAVDANEKFGLRGMQERARLVGGELSIESSPDKGTVVQLHIPEGG